MPKNKDKSGEEFWRGQVRQLKKKIRHLEKELSYYKKRDHLNDSQDEEVIEDTEDTFTQISKKIMCDGEDGCAKGYFVEIHLMDKIFGTCNVCGRRKRLK